MKFAVLIYSNETIWEKMTQAERNEMLGRYNALTEDLKKRGQYLLGAVRAHHRGDRARLPRHAHHTRAAAGARQAQDPRGRRPVPRARGGRARRAPHGRAAHDLPRVQRRLRRERRRAPAARLALPRGDPARAAGGGAPARAERSDRAPRAHAARRREARGADRRAGRPGAPRRAGPLALGPRADPGRTRDGRGGAAASGRSRARSCSRPGSPPSTPVRRAPRPPTGSAIVALYDRLAVHPNRRRS